MDCVINEALVCTVCGRTGKIIGGMVRKQMCRVPCTPSQKLEACPECGTALVKKQRLPEGKWYLRCPECRVDVRLCVPCNAAQNAPGPPKAESPATDAGTRETGR